MTEPIGKTRVNKTDADSGPYGICRVIDVFASAPLALSLGLPLAVYLGSLAIS
jgi:hypothetical protein